MASFERSGHRDLTFNTWHRKGSIMRFVSDEDAGDLFANDIDLVERDRITGLAVIYHEIGMDIGQANKQSLDIQRQARQAGVVGLLTLYKVASWRNPADQRFFDVERFRTRRIWPEPQEEFTIMTPDKYAHYINSLSKELKAGLREGICPADTLCNALKEIDRLRNLFDGRG